MTARMLPDLPRLPVTAVLPALRRALAAEGAAVLHAPPGAGKTTVVPLALLDEPWLGDHRIVVLEPRRLAARAAAYRMADTLGEEVGRTVGYRVRMDTRVSRHTRIEVVTEGVLTRMLQSDPALDGIGVVAFDEFHERSLHADLGLALTLQSREVLRPDLRLLVMSATLDTAPVAALLRGADHGHAPVVGSEGRRFPVETHYRKTPVDGWIEPVVARTVVHVLGETDGDVLVFLPGAAEIRRTDERLRAMLGEPGPRGAHRLPGRGGGSVVHVHCLFGALPREAQDRAIRPSPAGARKVVLATSIAETSLTIEGVRAVVDAGLMRVPRFSPATGMTRLETIRVTRDSADQRRGRAGRVAPGDCWRLWTREEDRGLVPARRPEILEADLAPLALELAAWGAPDPAALRWLDAPPAAAYAQALELLAELEAVEDGPVGGGRDGGVAITDHGRAMADLGLHPRLAHMLLRARSMAAMDLGADLAALLDDRDVLRGDGGPPDSDVRLRLDALRGGGGRVDRGGVARARKMARHWARQLQSRADRAPGTREVGSPPGAGRLLAFAYPDRIGRRRDGERGRFLLRNGRGATMGRAERLAGEDWIVAPQVDDRGRESRIFLAAPLELAEIEANFGGQVEERVDVSWDAEARAVRARRRRTLGALVLSESVVADPDPTLVSAALLEGVREAGLDALPWSKATRQLRERLQFLHAAEPSEWPDGTADALESTLEEWLLPFLAGMRRWDDLKRVDLREALLSRVPWDTRRRLDSLAPTHVEVPSGSSIPIDYSDPSAPAVAVRLQEVFGLSETPRIAGGRVPLTFELLSPARRPVQVTRDLASFWRDAYFDVRKEMRGRYPKHYWPEDPMEATATRRVRPKGE